MSYEKARPNPKKGREESVAVAIRSINGTMVLTLRPTKKACDAAGIEVGDPLDVYVDDEHARAKIVATRDGLFKRRKDNTVTLTMHKATHPLLCAVTPSNKTHRVNPKHLVIKTDLIEFELPEELFE